MRCKVPECKITTRQVNKYKCWSEYGLCFKHAIELHPEIYQYQLSTTRKFKRVRGERGRNHRFMSP